MTTRPWPLNPDPTWYLNSNWLQAGYARNGIFYEGDTVVIPRTAKFLATDPSTADFETGTNGGNLTATTVGSYTPFSAFNDAVYSNAHARSGSLSMSPGASGKISWNNTPLDGKTHYMRTCIYATANPSASYTFYRLTKNTGTTEFGIAVTTAGKLQILGHTFSTAIPLNSWFRVELGVYEDTSAGWVELRLYTGSSDTSPAETYRATGLSLQDVSVTGFRSEFGFIQGTWSFFMDDLVANSQNWVGPGSVVFPVQTHDYEIRDFSGDIVSSGSFNEYVCTPTPPVGGWLPGWYRSYFTGSQTDSLYGDSYGVTTFAVIRDDPHFPPMPTGDTAGGNDSASDFVMKGVLGLGTSRMPLLDLSDLNAGSYPISQLLSDVALTKSYWTNPGASYLDPNRPRYLWVNVPNQGVDKLVITNGVSGQAWGNIYCKDETIDGSQVFVALDNGTVSGKRLRVYSPDNVTLVETYDNLSADAAAASLVLAASSYIKFFTINGGTPVNKTVTAIGRTYYNNLVSAVSQAYTAGVHYFEGPTNEPNMALNYLHWIHEMRLFQAAVHAGNASAKAIGPCTVDLYTTTLTNFFANGGGAYCDEISVHAYNYVDGDIHIGKHNMDAFVTMLATYGQDSKPRWQTESTQGSSAIFTHVPHKNCRWFLWNLLLMEQYGFPRERNNPWYDKSHGFWSFDTFLRTLDGAVTPQAVLGRVLAEETWGKPYHSSVDFGTPGNDLFIGNLYVSPSDGTQVIAILPTSAMENGSVTFSITGTAGPLTAVDGFGNEASVSLSSGRATVDVPETSAYLRLPNGANATVFSCNDWSSQSLTEVTASSATVGGTSTTKPIDNTFNTKYDGSDNNAYRSPNSPPEDVTLTFSGTQTIDRVIVWSGFVWQNHCGLVKFDVQTTTNGTDWVTQATIDHSSEVSTFLFGAGVNSTGTAYESYYKEPWVFDVSFTPVNATGVRLWVYQTTFGGMPDTQSGEGQFSDNGVWQPQHVTIQEMKVYTGSLSDGGSGPPPDDRELTYSSPPYNWVFYNTSIGWGAHRRQEADMIEFVGVTKTFVLDRIDEYEASLVAKNIPVSNEWGELYGPAATDRARLISGG